MLNESGRYRVTTYRLLSFYPALRKFKYKEELITLFPRLGIQCKLLATKRFVNQLYFHLQ
jgi:hypothetical protein